MSNSIEIPGDWAYNEDVNGIGAPDFAWVTNQFTDPGGALNPDSFNKGAQTWWEKLFDAGDKTLDYLSDRQKAQMLKLRQQRQKEAGVMPQLPPNFNPNPSSDKTSQYLKIGGTVVGVGLLAYLISNANKR